MRLLICAGGTGGGVYPALAVLQALKNEVDPANELFMLWIGSEGGMEADLVSRAGIPYDCIPAAGLHGVGVRALPGNAVRLLRGYRKAKQIIENYNPDVLFFTGGYIAAPVAVAGARIPTLTFVPDIEPGIALKFLRRFSDRVALSAPVSKVYFPRQRGTFISGYPVRNDLNVMHKGQARDFFKLDNNLPVILVMGGSSGARSINNALIKALPELLQITNVIHISGRLDWPTISARYNEMLGSNDIGQLISSRYRVFPYLHEEMSAAYSTADLILSRAGASILGELPLFGLPAILVPYPYAWHYQKQNADYLIEKGAAQLLLDHELPEKLFIAIKELLSNEAALHSMSRAMSSLRRPDAAKTIAISLIQLGNETSWRRKSS
jgi:undecaprenyldiphospho-muramoylpentapeptide beta-N-acetylglucosaminyltransferase